MFDWDNLKILVAVARGGSTSAAARALGVNQTTVVRRIEALERDLGTLLVERSQAGAELTEAARALLDEAEAMQRTAERIVQKAGALRRQISGGIRLTCSEMIANQAVTPLLVEFRKLCPEVAVELVITDTPLDLAAGEADVAVRGAPALPNSDLIARKIGESDWALYCSHDYAARSGMPAGLDNLAGHALIDGEAGTTYPGMGTLRAAAPELEITYRSNSLTNLFQAVRAGFGLGPLPTIWGDAEPELVRALTLPDSNAATWVMTRPEDRDTPRVRALVDFLVPRLVALDREFRARGEANRAARAASAG